MMCKNTGITKNRNAAQQTGRLRIKGHFERILRNNSSEFILARFFVIVRFNSKHFFERR